MASVEPGDVLFGKLRPNLVKSWVADRKALASTELLCLRPTSHVDSRWLGYLVRSVPFVEWAITSSEGAKMPRTSWSRLGTYRLTLPPLSNQRLIADCLDTKTGCIATLISKKRRSLELFDEHRLLLGEEVLADLRESEQSIPLKRLVHESDLRYGSGPEPMMLSVSIRHGVVPRAAVSDMESRADNFSNYKVCRPGDIAVNRMRAFQGGLGIVRHRGVVSPDYTVLRVSRRVVASYLHFVMRSPWFVSEMIRRLRGIGSTDQGQVRTPRINFGDLGLIEVPLPSITRQNSLAGVLADQEARLARVVDLQLKQLAVLAERRQALITAAVAGERNL